MARQWLLSLVLVTVSCTCASAGRGTSGSLRGGKLTATGKVSFTRGKLCDTLSVTKGLEQRAVCDPALRPEDWPPECYDFSEIVPEGFASYTRSAVTAFCDDRKTMKLGNTWKRAFIDYCDYQIQRRGHNVNFEIVGLQQWDNTSSGVLLCHLPIDVCCSTGLHLVVRATGTQENKNTQCVVEGGFQVTFSTSCIRNCDSWVQMFVCKSCACFTSPSGQKEWVRSDHKSRLVSPKCESQAIKDCGALFAGVSTSLQMLWGLVRSDTVQRNAIIKTCWDNMDTKCEAEAGSNDLMKTADAAKAPVEDQRTRRRRRRKDSRSS